MKKDTIFDCTAKLPATSLLALLLALRLAETHFTFTFIKDIEKQIYIESVRRNVYQSTQQNGKLAIIL